MQLRMSIGDMASPEGELRSLHEWLLADPAARRYARPLLNASRSSRPGAQGDVIDLVSLLVGSGFSAASLGLSLVSWQATRPQAPTITVERPDGQIVTISGSSADEAARLVELLVDDSGDGDGRSA